MTPDAVTPADLLRSAVGRVGLGSATDGELVRRFAAHRDDLAFAELVHRYAPAVYAVCRRHLADPGTADDALQAVFVLLARKAGTLAHSDRVGGWLIGTADRVARVARRRMAKRFARHRPLESAPEPAALDAPTSDLRIVLDDELAKLPSHYRAVVLLCDVQSVPRREAAARLNIPVGTLGNRLTRARAVLGRRLLRRGVLVAAGGVFSGGSLAAPPARLVALTVRVALADSTPAELLSLTSEVPPMPRGKLTLAVVAVLVMFGGGIAGMLSLLRGPTPDDLKGKRPETPTTMAVSAADMARRSQPMPQLPQDDTGAFAFSPDGRWFVRAPNFAGLETKLSVIDTTTWKEVAKIDQDDLGTILGAVGVSADGKRVFLYGTNKTSEVKVWDTTAKRYADKPLDVGAERFGIQMKLSPDGSALVGNVGVSRQKRYFRVWDANTGDVLRTIDLPEAMNERFTFTDGGKTVAAITATVAPADRSYFVTEWNLETGKEKRRIDISSAVNSDRGTPVATAVAYTANGKQVIVGGGFALPEVKLAEVKPDTLFSNYPWSGSVWVIDRETGKVVKTLVDHHHDLVRRLHLTPDDKKVIVNPTLLSRRDRIFSAGGVGDDTEFVELQQWDAATWELDWVRIVPKVERWKIWNGAK